MSSNLTLYMSVVTAHMAYFSAYARSEIFQTKKARKLEVGCESLRDTHVFVPKLTQILNSNPSKRNKSTSLYSRSLLLASLSGCVHAGCFGLCKH